ncbi:MAG: hypothetical protein FJ028_04705 [Chloroflexi bacterium]|nr:hypothetical protein [Chloroflexota bacterium]
MFPLGSIASFIAAAVSAAALTPLAATVAARANVVAPARADRWGSRATPLLGGLAIALAILLPVTVFAGSEDRLTVVALGTLAALVLGVVDDVRGLRPSSKIVGQTVIASGVALGGLRVEIVDIAPLSFLLTVIWVVGLMNAVNLIDNMDGLAAGVAAIAAGVLVFMAPTEPAWIRLLAAATAGGCVGFLLHNFPPARVYMGDAGSMVLGFVLAALGLLLTNAAASNVALAVLGPLLVLGLPIFDTMLVTLARRIEGRPVSSGGRDHTSHRLVAHGLSERATVIVLYAIAAGLALLGFLSEALGLVFLPLAGLVLAALVVFGTFLLVGPGGEDDRHTPARRLVVGAGRRLIRFGGEIALDASLATIALFSAFLIRFESLPAPTFVNLFLQAAPIVIPVQLAAFVLLDVYRILWTYLGVTDLVIVLRASFVGTLVAGLLMLYVLGFSGQSKAVLLMDGVFLAVLVSGSRLFFVWLRHWSEARPRAGSRRVLIVGATERGQLALRLLVRNRDTAYVPAGFLDDDPGKHRRRIAGVPVLGRTAELSDVVARHAVDLVVVALADDRVRDEVRASCARAGVEMRELSRSLIESP